MYDTHMIGFEGLGIPPFEVNRVAISNLFGTGIDIYWYAIIITSGLILAMIFAMTHAKKVGLTSDNIVDIVLWGVPTALIGARLYYVIFEPDRFESFADIINIRKGGLAIYGGVIAAFLTGYIYCKVKKINFLALFDLGALGFFIGQSIGRWGNFMNAEAFGGETSLPWGMSINGGAPVHPTFLYESLWNVIGFLLAYLYLRKFKKEHGEIFFFYLAWYGAGRTWIEGLRTDSLWWGNFRVSQVLAAITCVIGVILIILVRIGVWRKMLDRIEIKRRQKNPTYVPVYKDTSDIPTEYNTEAENTERTENENGENNQR